MTARPDVLIILTDQWRAQSVGYAGDPNVETPRIDALARESIDFPNAISGTPVCCPARASLMTGQYPLQHGVYVNDVELAPNGPTLGEAYRDAGYRTGYIGKWHLHGSPDGHYGRRRDPVPADRRMGFEHWKAAECSHDYHESFYYDGDDPHVRYWPGYDADAQTEDAVEFILDRSRDAPYLLVVSFGPPHFPLDSAPDHHRERYASRPIELRPNVPDAMAEEATAALRGYYAHMSALDDCVGRLLDAVESGGRARDTVVVFTSDHGDMMGSQGIRPEVKVCPWDESVRIPFLLRHPARFGSDGGRDPSVLNLPDVMPTLLGLCDVPVPDSVTGADVFAEPPTAGLISLPVPILWARTYGLVEYRGVRTPRHTYVRTRTGPWLLHDNVVDPHQIDNLAEDPAHAATRAELDDVLAALLERAGDDFAPAQHYVERDGLAHYEELRNPIGVAVGNTPTSTSASAT